MPVLASAGEIELLLALLAVVAGIVWAARRLGQPYPIFLLGAGVGIGLVPGLPEIEVEPDVIFLVFLPPLVHAAAWTATPRKLWEQRSVLVVLCLALVGLTTAGVAATAHLVLGIGWLEAAVLGAALGPTDTVAATTIFRRVGAPEDLVAVVENESLINDGTSLALFNAFVAASVAGAFDFTSGGSELVVVGPLGAALGVAVAWVVRRVRLRVDDSLTEITITLLTPYAAFIGAEELGASGILAAASSGVYLGARAGTDFTPGVRLQATAFWSVLTFVLESVLFILIGLQAPQLVERVADREAVGTLVAGALAVTAAVVAVRLVVAAVTPGLGARRERAVVGWAGMRGAVSLAAALAIPAGVADRDLLLFLVIATIALTLLVQGLTLPLLVGRLAVVEHPLASARAKSQARFEAVGAALQRIGELTYESDWPPELVERARSMYTGRADQLAGECRDGAPTGVGDVAQWTKLRRLLLETERRALLDLRDRGRLPASVWQEVERDLDLEQERLDRVRPPAPPAPPSPPADRPKEPA